MHTARRTFVATGTVALIAAAGVTAAIAADPAPVPPPRIAFLANGIVPADALAAGPIAGQLGAPIYTTRQESLSPAAASGLDGYDPELVIVLGGPVAISDAVIDQVEAATGLTEVDTATPVGGIVRAAGGDRFDTAAVVADLVSAYNPAYLAVNMQAIDADTVDGKHASDFLGASDKADDADMLDGKDSTAFQPAGDYLGKTEKAADSDKLDNLDSSAFVKTSDAVDADTLDGFDSADLSTVAWVKVDGTRTIVDQSGGWTVTEFGDEPGRTVLDHPNVEESSVGFAASIYRAPGEGLAPGFVTIFAIDDIGFFVSTYDASGTASNEGYSIVVALEPGDLASAAAATTSSRSESNTDNR